MHGKLLVIDSEPFYREMMDCIFGSTYSIWFAKNVYDAGEVMKYFKPGVVFFELRQADKSQLTLIVDSVRMFCPDTPLIVAVTGNNKELECYARENKTFYYMLRPFNLKELCDAVECAFVDYEKKQYTK
jgi:DNA-binding NtrC family response regulator